MSTNASETEAELAALGGFRPLQQQRIRELLNRERRADPLLAVHIAQQREGLMKRLLEARQAQPSEEESPSQTGRRFSAATLPDPRTFPENAFEAFRDSFAAYRRERLLARSISRAPDNPGPLNPEMLTIKTLRSLHQESPAYLEALLPFAETLLRLDALLAGIEESPGESKGRKPRRRKA